MLINWAPKGAINMIKKGHKRAFVAESLNISIPTIDRWIALDKLTGDVAPKQNEKLGRKPLIQDKGIECFHKFAEENKLFSLSEMSFNWHSKISDATIHRYLKKFGYSYKKNSGYILKEMKSKESCLKKN